MPKVLNPIPSWIRASALDAGTISMQKAGRTKWNLADWNRSAETLERLVKGCYGRMSDHNEPNLAYIRFSVAEQMEKAGRFQHNSNLSAVMTEIDAALA